MSETAFETTEDRLLGGAVVLLQPRRGHRAGTDAVLLAGLAEVRPDEVVADLGAATGAVGLMAAVRHPSARVLLVERDPDLAGLARRNLALNGMEDRGNIVEADVFWPPQARRESGLVPGSVDLVLTNPPFFEGESRPSPDKLRRAAHEMEGGTLGDWIGSAADLLRHKGRLVAIYRADGLQRCLGALERAFGSVVVTPIQPRAGEDASRILVAAVKGGRAPLRIAAPFVLHEAGGAFTAPAARLHDRPT